MLRLHLDDLRLSPYTFSVYCALRVKEARFETAEVSFAAGRSTTPGFATKSVTDLIPCLEDGALVLSESNAILEYLEEKFPAPRHRALLPATIADRARARMLLSWYRSGMTALRSERSSETVFFAGDARSPMRVAPLSPEAKAETRELVTFLERVSPAETDGGIFGDWSIVDVETALMFQRLIVNGDVEGDVVPARWSAFAERQWEHPVVREFVAHPRKPFRSFYS